MYVNPIAISCTSAEYYRSGWISKYPISVKNKAIPSVTSVITFTYLDMLGF